MTAPTDSTDTVSAPGIVANPVRRRDKPTRAEPRFTVEEVLRKLAADWSIDEILDAWPHLSRHQILHAIAYAPDLVHKRAEALLTLPPGESPLCSALDSGADEDTNGSPTCEYSRTRISSSW